MGFFDSITPDFSDPKSMALFGALGNMLVQGGTSHAGTGMGAGNALAMLGGAGMQGAGAGAQAAQAYKGTDIGNQQKQMMLDYYKQMMPQTSGGAPSVGGSGASAPFGMPSTGGGVSPLYQQYQMGMMLARAPDANASRAGAQMLDTVQRYIGPGKVPNPDGSVSAVPGYGDLTASVAGQTKNAEAQNSIVGLPGGRQVPGSQIMPPFGSMAPSPQAPVSGPVPMPPAQSQGLPVPPPAGQANAMPGGLTQSPPISAAQLFGGPSSAGVDPDDPVGVAGATEAAKEAAQVAAAGPKAQAIEAGKNAAENAQQYNAVIANFQPVQDRIAEMHKAADQSSFDALNTPSGVGPKTLLHNVLQDHISVANKKLEQLKDQGLMSQLGPQLAANGVKGNKLLEGIITGADSLDLSAGKPALHAQIDGLYANYIKNMIAENKKAILAGVKPQPMPPIMMRTPKGIGTVAPEHVEEVIKAGGSFVFQ